MTEPVPLHIAELKSARRRAESMGRFHAWTPEFNAHPLAACIDNHTACINEEMEDGRWLEPFAVLCWVLNMARAVNRFCSAHHVAGEPSSEYWLERFLWVNAKVNSGLADMKYVGA